MFQEIRSAVKVPDSLGIAEAGSAERERHHENKLRSLGLSLARLNQLQSEIKSEHLEQQQDDIYEQERAMKKLHKYISDTLLKNLKCKSADIEVLKSASLYQDAKTKEETNINMKRIACSLLNLHASFVKCDDGRDIIARIPLQQSISNNRASNLKKLRKSLQGTEDGHLAPARRTLRFIED